MTENRLSLVGQRFHRLTVIERADNSAAQKTRWVCLCDCGNHTTVVGSILRNGHTKSCGCLSREMVIARNTTHGDSNHPLHKIWYQMVRRCTNPDDAAYKYYGGRGIEVCSSWLGFHAFLADMGERPEGGTLERKNNNGNYCPDNCIWASWNAQHANRRTTKLGWAAVFFARYKHHNGTSIADLCEFFGVHKCTMASAIRGATWANVPFPYGEVK